VVMTSNLCQDERFEPADEESAEARDQRVRAVIEELGGYFRPEFINRLDEIVLFNQLGREDMQRIVENELEKVGQRLRQKGHRLEVGPPVVEWLIDKSFTEDFGARPLKRGIEKHLEDPLSEQMLRGQLDTPYAITAKMGDDQIDFELVPLPAKPKPEPAKATTGPAADKKDEEPTAD